MRERTPNRVVVVTGGGTGIGRAVAHAFADRGAEVVVAGRRPAVLADAASGRATVHTCVVDLADADGPRALVEAVTARHGRLDVLVNNAAVATGGTLAELDETALRTVVATNLLAPIRLTSAALPLLTAFRGVVVTVSTAVGQRAWPGSSVYAATKAALESLTRSWAVELAGAGVRVVGVAPGAIDTPIGQHSGLTPEQVAEQHRRQRERTPARRLGRPEEVAAMVVALADPAAAFVTGAILAVDGGAVIA